MKNYTRTTLAIAVHPPGVNPIFGEASTHVILDDDAAGPYIVLNQCGEDAKVGEIRVTYEELTELWQAAEALLAGWPEDGE